MANKPKTDEEIIAQLGKDFRPWFKKAVEKEYLPLAHFVENLEKYGYVLDSCGFMFKKPLTDAEIKKAGHTILDVAFLRPSTYHLHYDVAELVEITHGLGTYVHKGECMPVEKGQLIYTPAKEPHAWVPKKNCYLSIHLVCSGILNDMQEKELLWFEDLETYLTKYAPALRGDKI